MYSVLPLGVIMVAVSLVIASCLGIFQEVLYKRHGKHSKEAMFYSHALSLPFFVFLGSDILQQAAIFNKSAPVVLWSWIPSIPILWLYLIINVMTQYVCVRSVFILTSEYASLTVTLVITLRKFLSLIFSVLYFQNPFTVYHWAGSLLTFTGSMIFSGLHVNAMVWLGVMKEEKKKEKVEYGNKASSVSEEDMNIIGHDANTREVRRR
jgi:UDP-xylose/UDP-N-acetylglucosamine transporter B4